MVMYLSGVCKRLQSHSILGTDNQLQELKKNCTNSHNFGVLSLDLTFDLKKLYVTRMVFPLWMFYSKRTGKSPYYIGPLLIHQTLKEPVYHYFCSQLVGMRLSLHNVLSIGTDCEEALSNAVYNTFTSVTHLRCFKHVKDNTEEKLQRVLNIVEVSVSEILNDIFGYKLVWLMLKVRMISLTSLLPSNQSGTPLRTNLDMLKKEPIHLFLFMHGL